jgi:hypothetical protein
MANQIDLQDKNQAEGIWFHARKTTDGRTANAREVWKLIGAAAKKAEWDRSPSENTVLSWIREWDRKVRDVPGDEMVLPWDDNWQADPQNVVALTLMSDVVREIVEISAEILKEKGREPGQYVNGFPKSVCDWAGKIRGFFDLELRHDCLALVYFAYLFGNLERYSLAMGKPIAEVSKAANQLLVRWYRTKRNPDLAPNKGEVAGFAFLWDQQDHNDSELELEVINLMYGGYALLVPRDLADLKLITGNLAPNKT